MYYSHLAEINVGVITTIWSVQPLVAAIVDRIAFGTPFQISHLFGMILIIGSSVCISQNSMLTEKTLKNLVPDAIIAAKFPAWPAIIFGFVTPCFFLASASFNKHITHESINFHAPTLSYGSSFVASTVVIIIGLTWYWRAYKFSLKLFLIGIAGSVFDTAGKAFIQNAYANGPMGPIAACVELNNILLVIICAGIERKVPSWLEIVAFILGITGGLFFVIPAQIYEFFKCVFCCQCRPSEHGLLDGEDNSNAGSHTPFL